MATKARGSETAGDVVRTCLIFFGLLALVAGFFALNRPEPRLPEAVEYQSLREHLQEEYPYHVEAPASVPDHWRATSVDHSQAGTGNRWRLGFLIDGDAYVGLEQSDGEIESYLRERLADFDEQGTTVRISGDAWEQWLERDRNPDRALVRVDDGVVTIVRGTTSFDTLEQFIGWLE